MNILQLAEIQLEREQKEVSEANILKYAVSIRKWLDKHGRNTALAILSGAKVYQYGDNIKTYSAV